MITATRTHKYPSSGANRPSDIAVTVNINAEFNLMTVNPIIECYSRDLVPEYYQGLESTVVYTAPPSPVQTLPGPSNWSLPCLPLHMHAQAIILTFLTSNIYIGLCLPKALTLIRLRLYQMFELLRIIRINRSMGLRGFSTSVCQETRISTGWREGFYSRSEFRSLYSPRLELYPLIFAEPFPRSTYHSMRDFHPVCYTATVNKYSDCHARYEQS